MKATQQLNELGQSLWLDNITRDLLDSGTLKRYIADLSVTGLTSNPTIFDHAITHSSSYDEEIRQLVARGHVGRGIVLRVGDRRPARAPPTCSRRSISAPPTVDGWVSLEVSPLLAYDAKSYRGRGEDAVQKGQPPQSVHQDSRHQGGRARDRRSNLRRRNGQCDAAVHARALSGRRRRLHARAGAPRRRRSQP